MPVIDIERELGLKGTAASILSADDFPNLLSLVYGVHHGEIWLYNNDLSILLEERNFIPVYLNGIAGPLGDKIDAVKIFVSEDAEHHVFGQHGISDELMGRLRQLQGRAGSKRIRTMYFGRASQARERFPALKEVPRRHTWVFYTQGGKLDSPNHGFVLMRPSEFPFAYSKTEVRYAFAWQMTEDHLLRKAFRDAIFNCFTKSYKARHLLFHFNSLKPSRLVSGWSNETARILKKPQFPGGGNLSFGEDAHCVVLASRADELKYFETLVPGGIAPVPSPQGAPHRYHSMAIETRNGPVKILLADVGEGPLIAATRTWDIMSRWKPRHVILVGVAGADPHSDKPLQIGDVVVAETTVDYEAGSVLEEKFHGRVSRDKNRLPWTFKARSKTWEPDGHLKQLADQLCTAWPPREFRAARPAGVDRRPEARLGIIGSGAKVVETPTYFEGMIKPANFKIDTIETEAAAVCLASENSANARKALVVRGVMDHCNARTRKGRKAGRDYARMTSCRFVYDLLRML